MRKSFQPYVDSESQDQPAYSHSLNRAFAVGKQNDYMGIIECFNREQAPGWDLTHVQDVVNPHILRMLEDAFLLDTANLFLFSEW